MINPINNTSKLISNPLEKNKFGDQNDISFTDILKDRINNTNELIKESDRVSEAFALGKIDNIHQVTIAAEKAGLALNLTLAVQNKVVQAYQEIMRIQI